MSKGFQFKTVDVEFWSSPSPESSSRSARGGVTWQKASASFQQQKTEEIEPWNLPYTSSSLDAEGKYSVKNARGIETETNQQNHVEKTFYTLVTHNRRRLEDHEVYLPTKPSVVAVDRSTPIPARNETIQMVATKTKNNGGKAKITNHTIRSTDTVPIVRIPKHYVEKVETSNVIHGSIASRLNNISGKSVVRDMTTGQKMNGPQQERVTYKYKVDASERRIDYKYHSETMLYNYEQMTKREQLETWTSLNRKPVTRESDDLAECEFFGVKIGLKSGKNQIQYPFKGTQGFFFGKFGF